MQKFTLAAIKMFRLTWFNFEPSLLPFVDLGVRFVPLAQERTLAEVHAARIRLQCHAVACGLRLFFTDSRHLLLSAYTCGHLRKCSSVFNTQIQRRRLFLLAAQLRSLI